MTLLTASSLAYQTITGADIATRAVAAIHAEADLTPKPGLVDKRGSGSHTDMDLTTLHASADSLHAALVECACTATQFALDTEWRARLGEIGRAGERSMMETTGGVNTHRGALWALGLLSAGFAAAGGLEGAVDVAARLAAIPDPHVTVTTSPGARARSRYGVSGAAGEAQAAFPHVRQHALPALRAARNRGDDEASARLMAPLALMATVDDTCVLHRGGREGLRALQSGAQAVLDAGGIGTPQGKQRFTALDDLCLMRRLSPGGSGDLLAATIFLDDMDQKGFQPCKP